MEYRIRSKAIVLYAVATIASSSCASRPLDFSKAELAADNSAISAAVAGASPIHLQERGDLDSDGDTDVLVVVGTTADAAVNDESRALLIFLRNASGRLEMAATSPRAILCRTCGGAMGDPLQGIDAFRGGFVLRFEGGSRELWQRHYRFIYSKDARTWALDSVNDKVLDRIGGELKEGHATAPGLEAVPIEQFDAKEFQEDTILDL